MWKRTHSSKDTAWTTAQRCKQYCQNTGHAGAACVLKRSAFCFDVPMMVYSTYHHVQEAAVDYKQTQWMSRSESFWPRQMSQQSGDETATSRPRLLSPGQDLTATTALGNQDADMNAPRPRRCSEQRRANHPRFHGEPSIANPEEARSRNTSAPLTQDVEK